jgi:hypothetical protein
MIDLADCIHGIPADKREATLRRLQQMSKAIGCFAMGALLAALLFGVAKMWCFVVPPAVAALGRFAAQSMARRASTI